MPMKRCTARKPKAATGPPFSFSYLRLGIEYIVGEGSDLIRQGILPRSSGKCSERLKRTNVSSRAGPRVPP